MVFNQFCPLFADLNRSFTHVSFFILNVASTSQHPYLLLYGNKGPEKYRCLDKNGVFASRAVGTIFQPPVNEATHTCTLLFTAESIHSQRLVASSGLE